MKLVVPDCYLDFACLADRCRHTCCAGWEIDIDPASLALYQSLPGPIGERLRGSIDVTEEGACFRLTARERCPMLNDSGLCDLITACGDGALCQICADHPRFRSFFTDRTEVGLGLCCEAAGMLLLSRREPLRLTVLEDDGGEERPTPEEEALLALRDALFAAAQDRTRPVTARLTSLCALGGLPAPAFDRRRVAEVLLGLERLDEDWTALLEQLRDAQEVPPLSPDWEVPLEQLLVCLLYRHLPGALDDGLVRERIALCLTLWQTVRCLLALRCKNAPAELPVLVELARMMSSEIEYDEENLDALLAFLRII